MIRQVPMLLAGCLLVSKPPPGAKAHLDCVDTGCADGFGCDTFYDECASACSATQPCQNGYLCQDGACGRCVAGDCPDSLGCLSATECRSRCFHNSDCGYGNTCCTSGRADDGACSKIGACF